MRDIEDYAKKYSLPGFERYKVLYRRKKLLELIKKYTPQNILEIGCGSEPLFQHVENTRFTIVEPAREFYDNAVALAEENDRIICLQGFFEDVADQLLDEYDLIVCVSLLHELENPDKLLSAIAQVCNKNTVVHINVPNANSMHRLLGKEMGILENVHDMSSNNKDFQQNNVYDSESLKQVVEANGFEIIENGSFFVKPFSHEQMYQMMESGIISENVLEGLYELGNYMPEFGSEIYVNCRLKW